MAYVYPLTPNPQQACHGISIRQRLGDKEFPTPDPNFGKAVLKVKHSFARVQNSRVNVKSRLIKLVLLPLWYGNKDIIRDTLS